MRRFMYLTVAALLGAGSYLAYHRYQGTAEIKPPAAEPAVAAESGKEPVLPGPILSEENEAPISPPRAAQADPAAEIPARKVDEKTVVSSEPSVEAPQEMPPEKAPEKPPEKNTEKNTEKVAEKVAEKPANKPPARPPLARESGVTPAVTQSGNLDEMIRICKAAFAAGDSPRGVKLLREIFQSGKDRPDVNIVPEARQLLESEDRENTGGPELKVQIYRYLEAHDTDPLWRYRASLAIGTAETKVDGSPDDLKAAWKHLTGAYLAASTAPERQKVMEVLRPFVNRHVFSKRFSPLVETYTVKAGDSLNRIAKARGTTEDAIQRLNQIKGTVIQPGQRLILLAGKPRIFVKKSEFRLWLMMDDRLLLEFPVGLGRDNSTPASVFVIKDRQRDPIWYRPGEPPIPYGDPRNILGSRWLGFKNTELVGFGIHGTADPSSIGKEASSGCIRLRNEDVEVLWDLIPHGTEVEIRE